MLEFKINITKKEVIERLLNNSNMAQLSRDFETMLKTEWFKNLSYSEKKIEIEYHNYSLLSTLAYGKKEFNRELDLLAKRYL